MISERKKKQYVYDTCTNELVIFKPGEHMRKMFLFSVSDKGGSEENIRELPTGVKPMTF